MSNQRRLGRGLEALLGRSLDEQQPAVETHEISSQPEASTSPADNEVLSTDERGQRWLDVTVIQANPFQPRKHFDEVEIADLADSFRTHGVLSPLVVRQVEDRYEVVAGERRLRAAQAAGWRQVPVLIKELDDRQTAEIAIVENVQRKDLNAIEKANSFQQYLRQYDCTQEELAKRIQIDRSTVANLIRLLELPDQVKKMVQEGELSQGHARALLSLDASQQVSTARQVLADGLSVRKTEELVQEKIKSGADEGLRVVGSDGVSRQATTPRSAQLAKLEKDFRTSLGVKVDLKQTAKGKGKITIHFSDNAEFERLYSQLTQAQRKATGTE